MDLLYVVLGIILLFYGGEWTLTGVLAIANRFGISKVFSAVVLVGFATSAPELFVSVNAVLSNTVDIAIGNILGSNIANILLISGVGLVLAPIIHKIKFIKLEIVFFLIAGMLPLLFVNFNEIITRLYGIIMVLLLIIYFYLAFKRVNTKKVEKTNEKELDINLTLPRSLSYSISGIILLVFGSNTLVTGAVNLAIIFNLSQGVIGALVVAIGTSLPELAATFSAARKNEGEVIIGNVLGSNIFNILLVLSSTTIFGNVDFSYDIFGIDTIIVAITTIIFVIAIWFRKLIRPVGAIFLISYALYAIKLISG